MQTGWCSVSNEVAPDPLLCLINPMEVLVDRFINHENINSFADKLLSELDPAQRATLTKLLIEGEDRLVHRTEELELATQRLASCRKLIAQQQRLIARLALDGHETSRANRLLDVMLEVEALFEAYQQKILDALK